jgi:hypothetical protein
MVKVRRLPKKALAATSPVVVFVDRKPVVHPFAKLPRFTVVGPIGLFQCDLLGSSAAGQVTFNKDNLWTTTFVAFIIPRK